MLAKSLGTGVAACAVPRAATGIAPNGQSDKELPAG